MNGAVEELYGYASSLRVLNTHCHHSVDHSFEQFDLTKLLQTCYVSWCGEAFDTSRASREHYLHRVRYKSFFRAVQKGIMCIYGLPEELSAGNWDTYDEAIKTRHKNAAWHMEILRDICGYDRIILDAYWDPGSNNGHPELFDSAFRIDPLLFGFSKTALDHDGNNAYSLYGNESDNLDDYLAFIYELIKKKVRGGIVCIKNAIAYDRNLIYGRPAKAKASRAFGKQRTQEDILHFQDYVFHEICAIAAEFNLPVQCHTGMGCIDRTRAAGMLKLVQDHPDTKFSMMHGSFPWCSDLLAYLDLYPNVFVDLVWLPALSPTVAEHYIRALVEVGTSNRLYWGCDTWNSEASYGARLLANETIANAMGALVDRGYFSKQDAMYMIKRIFWDNAHELFQIG